MSTSRMSMSIAPPFVNLTELPTWANHHHTNERHLQRHGCVCGCVCVCVCGECGVRVRTRLHRICRSRVASVMTYLGTAGSMQTLARAREREREN
jgi:hypothetical protein